MTYQGMLLEPAAVSRRREPRSAGLSDQLTISGRLIERRVSPDFGFICIMPDDWPVRAPKPQCSWLPFVSKQLDAIASLTLGWDSYGAPGPDIRLVAAAQGLIECLAQVADVPKPHVNPTRSGGVQFEWEAGDRYFELEVVDERVATYLYCDEVACVEDTGKVREQESLEPVLAYIRRVGTHQ